MGEFLKRSTVPTIAFILFSFSSLSRGETRKEDRDYWQETGIGLSIVETFLSDKCNSSAMEFSSCISGVNELLINMDRPLVLANSQLEIQSEIVGGLVDVIGPFEIHSLKFPSHSLGQREYWEFFKKELRTNFEYWKNHFETASPEERDLSPVFKWIKQEITADQEPLMSSLAINGFYEYSRDPHTIIIPKARFDEMQSPDSENFSGVGAAIEELKGQFIVSKVIENSPAAKAGLQVNDILLEIDGAPLKQVTLTDVVQRMKGPENTHVKLKISRKSGEHEFDIVRAQIQVDNITFKKVHHKKADIDLAYIKIGDFTKINTCQRFVEKLGEIFQAPGANYSGLIIDVRDNPGGLLSQVACISNVFLRRGSLVVTERDLRGENVTETFRASLFDPMIPEGSVVVLMDAGSASASEILGGVMQDHKRGLVVGIRSFGKGSVQRVKPWDPLSKDVYLLETTGRFYLPANRTNQIHGIIPDFEAYTKPNPTEEEKYFFREEDRYVNALTHLGPSYVQPRPRLIEYIQKCRSRIGEAMERFVPSRIHTDETTSDYQLLVAADVQACEVAAKAKIVMGQLLPYTKAISSLTPIQHLKSYIRWNYSDKK